MTRFGMWMGFSLVFACGETKVSEVYQEPVATITSPTDGAEYTEGDVASLQGTVSDPDTDLGDLLTTWYAGDTEVCGPTAPDDDGFTLCADVSITVDMTEIRLEVKDPTNLVGIDQVSIEVEGNAAPTVSFTEPNDDEEFILGETIGVIAQVADPDGAVSDLTLDLTQTRDGETSAVAFEPLISDDGTVTGTIELDEGSGITLTLTVTDAGGKSHAAHVTNLSVVGAAPEVALSKPVTGDIFAVGETIALEALVNDEDDDESALTMSIESSVDADLEFESMELSSDGEFLGSITLEALGEHMLTLSATDPSGLVGSDQVLVQVVPANSVPTCEITSPTDETAGEEGALVTLAGIVNDADQAPNTLDVTWSSDKDGDLGSSTADSDTGAVETSTNTLSVNTHQLTLTATDDEGESCTASVTYTVGQAPSVVIVQPVTGDVFGPGDVITFEGTVSDSEDLAADLTVVWASDLAEDPLSTDPADSSGTTQFTLNTTDDDLAVGTHTITLSVTDSDGLEVEELVTIDVTDNNAPVVSDVTISPNPAGPADTLTCSYTFTDADGDGDASTISWTIAGAEVGTTSTLAGVFVAGDEVTCTVTPNDGTTTGTPQSDSLTIDNTAPELTSVTVTPESPGIDDTLTCTAEATDVDGDEVTFAYSWTVDGSEVGTDSTLTGAFVGGDEVTCTVTPSDESTTGDTGSDSVTIGNTVPEVSTVEISPDPAASTDTLECTWVYLDRDGDADASTVSWTIDGTEVGTEPTLSGVFTGGDEVTCTVTAYDDIEVGGSSSASVVIGNTTPVVSAVTITPVPAYSTSTLTCSWTFTDPDGDADESTVSWTVGGTEVGTDDTLSGAFGAGDEVTCTVTPYDGLSTGAPDSDSIVIDNTAPEIVGVYITPDPVYADSELSCASIGYSDAEDDADASVPDWYINGTYASSGDTLVGGFAKDDTVTCSITPFDGVDYGASKSDTVTVQNKQPEVLSVSISPTAPFTDDDLVAVTSTFDVDGDTVELTHVWEQDGAESGASSTDTVSAVDTVRDQEWLVTVSPNDGELDGDAMTSSAVVIGNTEPTAPAVAISPSDPVTETDDLYCEVVTDSSDEDGDDVTYAFAWTVDGSAYSGSTATTEHAGDTIPVASTDYLQTWVCTATPSDGSLEGSGDSDSVITSCEVLTWYADGDDDGYGDDYDTVEQCDEPAGYVSTGGDCVPDDPTLVDCPSDGDSDWTRVDGTEPVAWAAVGMDTENDRILVYGGQTYHALSDALFAFDMSSETWDISSSVSGADPGTRRGHASYFAEGEDFSEMVIFGGEDYHTLTDELFVLDAFSPGAETWTDLTSAPPPGGDWPEPRTGASMVYDPETDTALMWGGRGYYGLLSDMWELDASGSTASWTELAPGGDYPTRAFATAVYDASHDVIYAFGGEDYHQLADTVLCLDMDTMVWSEVTPSGSEIAALTDAAAVYSPDYRAIVLYGGQGYHALPDQAYYIEPTGACEINVTALDPGDGTSPGGLAGAGIVWDSEDDVALLVGGQSYYKLSESIYSLVP